MKKVLIVLGIILLPLIAVIATRPSEFRVTRSAAISAPPATVFSYVNDLHKWEVWSPWAKVDPNMKKIYEGASAGTGAIFHWAGNNEAGVGSTTITESSPNDLIQMKLAFEKPFKGESDVVFTFKPEGDQTIVTWSMSGKNNFIAKAVSLVMNCDKMVGGQFEQGLTQLKSVVEAGSK